MAVHEHAGHWSWTVAGARGICSSRLGGVSQPPWESCNIGLHVGDDVEHVLENRRRAASLLGVGIEAVAGVTQVHGVRVWIDPEHPERPELPGLPEHDVDGGLPPAAVRWSGAEPLVEADALVTTRRGIALAVGVADCLPIALVNGRVVAAIHAGWRSLAGGVVEATLAAMRDESEATATSTSADAGPRALVGPALGACCFEVGPDVAARFDDEVLAERAHAPDRWLLDARADATRRLLRAGCTVEHVDVCTRCDPRCFSHRGDAGGTGRQALLVMRD